MNHYTCPVCGQTSHSAAKEANMIDPSCPYCAAKAAPNGNSETAKRESTTDYTPKTSTRQFPSQDWQIIAVEKLEWLFRNEFTERERNYFKEILNP